MRSGIYDRYQKVIFFDTETTGLDPKCDQIIELAAIVCEHGNTRAYDSFVRLTEGRILPEQITALTGITEADCKGGIEESEMLRRFTGWCRVPEGEKSVIIAHNAQFDLNFIEYAFKRHILDMGPIFAADYLDTLTIYRDRAGYPHRLQAAVEHYGLSDKVQNTHRAIDDVYALKAVFDAMAEERDDLQGYVNLFGFDEKYGISGALLRKVNYYRQAPGHNLKIPERTLPERWNRLDLFEQIDYENGLLRKIKEKENV